MSNLPSTLHAFIAAWINNTQLSCAIDGEVMSFNVINIQKACGLEKGSKSRMIIVETAVGPAKELFFIWLIPSATAVYQVDDRYDFEIIIMFKIKQK